LTLTQINLIIGQIRDFDPSVKKKSKANPFCLSIGSAVPMQQKKTEDEDPT
jgi:hypothetical protein